MKRRHLLLGLGGAILLPSTATAQRAGRMQRICWMSGGAPRTEPYNVAFVEALAKLGFVEGKSVTFEFRNALGRTDRFPELAADLVRGGCDVFFSTGAEANLLAATQATKNTPIVMFAADFDPVANGHIKSLARPGGRITGIVVLQTLLTEKRVEAVRELLPQARRIGVFSDSATVDQLKVAVVAAKRLGLDLYVHEFKAAPYDFEAAFADLARAKVDAVLALGSTFFVPFRKLIPELALKYRMPSVFNNDRWVESGGLMSYGTNFLAAYLRTADQVAKVLKGVKPADIPVEQPTVVELVINMKTAKALGITIPQGVWFRAERIIE